MIRRLVRPVVRFANWALGPPAPGLDLFFGVVAAGWAAIAALDPDTFATPAWRFVARVPALALALALAGLAVAHLVAALRPARAGLRLGALLVAAFVWLFVGFSLVPATAWTGVTMYCLMGLACLVTAVYAETERLL